MTTDWMLVLANSYALPSLGGCLLSCAFYLSPFVVIGIAARSLFSEEPLPLWAFAFVLAFSTFVAYILILAHASPFATREWLVVGWVVMLIGPAILIWDGLKRGWADLSWEWPKRGKSRRRPKRKKRKTSKPRQPEDPGHG